MPRHSPCALFSLTFVEARSACSALYFFKVQCSDACGFSSQIQIRLRWALNLVKLLVELSIYLVSLVELCRLIFRSFSLAKIVFYPNNKFPFMLPSHNCIIITMFSFQGTSWALSQETQWNIIFMMLQSISLVESTGIEPVTSCLQGRRSPSWANPPNKRF